MKAKFWLVFKIISLVVISAIVVLFFIRNHVFNYLISETKDKFLKKYNCHLSIADAKMNGLIGFTFKEIFLVPVNRDTLVSIANFEGRISIPSLISGAIALNSINVRQGKIYANHKNGKDNFSFLFKRNATVGSTVSINYGKVVHRLLENIFAKIPYEVECENLSINYEDEKENTSFLIKELSYKDKIINTTIGVGVGSNQVKWILNGTLDKGKETLEGKMYAVNTPISIPYIQSHYQLSLGGDTAYFSLSENDYGNNVLTLKGKLKVDNLKVRHPKIDSNTIEVKNLNANYSILIGEKSLSIEFPRLNINQIPLYIKATYAKDSAQKYSLKANMNRVGGQTFFNSLPKGLCASFEGIQVSGDLEYHLDFELDRSKPDCVKFESQLKDYDFRIEKFGSTNFSKMSGSFTYTAYEKQKAVRSFEVGPENPLFVSINEISPYLKTAVLQSEDGSFYWHKGFREDAFRNSLAENVKAGRFVRGGSTISMQLVKNVFLTRTKTIARKLEEALIVWVIENKRLTSKERMYEVYLNVIEWGPLVYGIKDASQFYFAKAPSDLSIEESIFLASIIPRPKAFKYSFDEEGNLRSYLGAYYNKLGDLLLSREVISEQQRASIVPNVKLTGRAKYMVIKDTLPVDDIEDDEF